MTTRTTNDGPRVVVADSSGLVSLVHPGDANHARAKAAVQHLAATPGSILLPCDVFTETINVMGRMLGHAVAEAAGQELLKSQSMVIVETSTELLEDALARFKRQATGVSLTDCLVMAVADFYDTQDIFGFDAIFRQQGYHFPGGVTTSHEGDSAA